EPTCPQPNSVRPIREVEEDSLPMPDISKRLDKAEKYLQRGKPEAALEEYLSILQDEPRNEQVRQTAADLCLALGRGSEAATLLSSMFEQEVESGDAAYESALAGFEKQRKNSQALAAAKRIVELSPTAENHQRTGEKAALMGDGRMAAANFVQL